MATTDELQEIVFDFQAVLGNLNLYAEFMQKERPHEEMMVSDDALNELRQALGVAQRLSALCNDITSMKHLADMRAIFGGEDHGSIKGYRAFRCREEAVE